MGMRRKRTGWESAGVLEARRALKLPKRPPNESDVPRPSRFPGRRAAVLPGQLDFNGNEV
jgi:hypothetical protein